MQIVEKRKALATIVTPESATLREAFAAAELQKYIRTITGAVLPVACGYADGNVILIGGPERNRLAEQYISRERFLQAVPGLEGMLIKTVGNDALLIAGSSGDSNEKERGTVYAVYEFLERYLGCSFAAYGMPDASAGEFVPRLDSIAIGNIEYVKGGADLGYRTAIVQFDGCDNVNADANHALVPAFIDWLAKNRYNRMLLTMKSYELFKQNGALEEIRKRGLSLTVGHHDSGTFFLPPLGNNSFPEMVFKTHPEYYKLQSDGTRYLADTKWHGQLVFDLRNGECARAMASNISAWIHENPDVDAVTIWPNDGTSLQCVCEQCRIHSKTDNYAWFVSEVARAVNQEHPHVRIDLLIYQDLWEPPEATEIAPGVLVDVSTWGPGSILRSFGKKDGSGLVGTYIEKNAERWGLIAGGYVYYDYYMTNFDSKQVYCPMADEILAIHGHCAKYGSCKGSGTQIEPYNIWNYLFNFYTHGRAAYCTDLSLDELLDRFARVFGKGCESVKEYIRYVESFYEGQADTGLESAAWFMGHVDRDRAYGFLENAFTAEDDEKFRDNIRLLRMAFRYSDLQTFSPGCDELRYMSREFGSYWSVEGQRGCGLAVLDKPGESTFCPDKWYRMAKERS